MSFRIMSIPGKDCENPYIRLFYEALASYGVELVDYFPFKIQRLQSKINDFDAIHLHWPENIWRNYRDPTLKKIRKSGIKGTGVLSVYIEKLFKKYFDKKSLRAFKKILKYLKKNDKKIIWTWHNAEPHENSNEIDMAGQKILARYCDLIIFHNKFTENVCKGKYEIESKTIVMEHGNYEGAYPNPQDRHLIIEELGLDANLPIVGFIGNIRDYKGIDIAVDACSKLNDQVQFLCAGKPHKSFDPTNLKMGFAKLKKHALILRFITDQEFSDYCNVCNIILLPYRSVSGSGALLAALTLGTGVIASDLPFFKEILNRSTNAGRLFTTGDCHDLSSKIKEYLKIDESDRLTAARELAASYAWDKVVHPVAHRLIEVQSYTETVQDTKVKI